MGTRTVRRAVLEVRNSPAVGWLLLAVSVGLFVLLAVSEVFHRPIVPFLAVVAGAVGVWRLLDRRVRLRVSSSGILHRDWANHELHWNEFTGYDRATWRNNAYVQFIPRQPEQLLAKFSPVGRTSIWRRVPLNSAMTLMHIATNSDWCSLSDPRDPAAYGEWSISKKSL